MGKIKHAVFLLRLAMVPKQAHALAEAARRGLTDNKKPRRPTYCEMFARLCREDAYGTKFNFAWLGTARKAGLALKARGYSVPVDSPIQPGDQAYKVGDEGDQGHVGTAVSSRIHGILWAENSTIHADDSDARGLRTRKEFGAFDVLIRFNN
jgi:hypothetical protein